MEENIFISILITIMYHKDMCEQYGQETYTTFSNMKSDWVSTTIISHSILMSTTLGFIRVEFSKT